LYKRGLEGRIVIDARVDFQRDAVAQVVHAARGDREAQRESLEDARIVGVGLEQALHRHAVFERLLRVLAALDGPRRVGDGVAEAFALRGHEQQLFDQPRSCPSRGRARRFPSA
jgi:hypothetical protein